MVVGQKQEQERRQSRRRADQSCAPRADSERVGDVWNVLVLVRAHSEIGNRGEGLIGFHVSHREGGAVFSRVGDQQSPRPMSFIAPFPRGTLSAVLACQNDQRSGARARRPLACPAHLRAVVPDHAGAVGGYRLRRSCR